MAIDRDEVAERYPWLMPHTGSLNVMMGDDLDAVLSAVLFLHLHPQARLIGVYHRYREIICGPGLRWDEICSSVWLDLDIYHSACRSLGHHIVRISPYDRLLGFHNSCNINLLIDRDYRDFKHKYPLGTIHFLMYLYGVEIPSSNNADLLIWLADSAYINGQSHRYPWNVREWIQQHIPVCSLQACLNQIDTLEFENRMADFCRILESKGFQRGREQVQSRYKRLGGYQCQPRGEVGPYIQSILGFVSELTGWQLHPYQVANVDQWATRYMGNRSTARLDEVKICGLDCFLRNREVFSFAIPSRTTLNYTNRINDQPRSHLDV